MDDVRLVRGGRGKTNIVGDLGLPKLNQKRRGAPKGGASVSQDIRERVAALTGTGISKSSIANQLGISARRVQQIINGDLKHNKNGLRDIQQAVLAKHHPAGVKTLEKAYRAIDKGMDLYMELAGTEGYEKGPTLREVVAGADMLAERVVYPNTEEAPEIKRTSLNIDLKDPAALRELFRIMRGEPEQKTIDVTPEP
jgi:hypothetical protein